VLDTHLIKPPVQDSLAPDLDLANAGIDSVTTVWGANGGRHARWTALNYAHDSKRPQAGMRKSHSAGQRNTASLVHTQKVNSGTWLDR
jgi:hypothetical protein